MADKTPIRAVYDNNSVATGLAEYQTGETVGVAHGGTGAVTFVNNRVLTGNTVAALVDEANLTFDGSTLAVTGAATVSTTLGVTGVISPTTHGDMPDSANIKLGTGDDMQLYHDGTNSYITNSQGALKIATETSGIALTIGHTTSETTIADNLTVTGNAGVTGNLTVTGTSTFNGGTINLGDAATDTIAFGGTITGNLVFEGSTDDAYETTLTPGNPSADIALTLPSSASDTLVGKATTDVLTNKTLTSALITTNLSPTSADGAALGSATKEFSDLFLADAAVINLGADQDVTLTHVADTGVLLNSTRKIQFGDSASFIHQSADGVMTIDGEATIDLNASTAVLVSNDLKLNSDAAVLGLGADNDVTLTHVADTGVLLNSTMAIQFNDASQYINAPSNAILDINATDEIELNATLVDVNANLDVSGTYTGAGLMTTGGNIVIPNDGNIGTVGDADSITIDTSGNVTVSQNLTITGNYTVNGTTTTISTTNMVVEDNLIELNNGAGSNANDSGIVIERGSTGNNAIFIWDESGDTFQVGTTTATGSSTGNLSVTDAPFAAAAITSSGVVTATGFTIGSAVIVESELEMIDGITAGTAAASKALVLDGNKDIGTIRNLTIDGTFSDGNYTFDTSGNVSGLGTISSGAITSSGTLSLGEDATIIFEGATDGNYETTLTVTDPTADRTVTLPNATGILANQAYAQMIAIALG